MNREYTYKILAHDVNGTITVEYSKDGKPTILRRIGINLATPVDELEAVVANAVQNGAPFDVWDADEALIETKTQLLESLVGVPFVAELPPIMDVTPTPAPNTNLPPVTLISEEDYIALYNDGLVDIHPDIFFGKATGVPHNV